MTTNIKKYTLAILPQAIVILGIALIVMLILNNRERGSINATYVRFEVCALNVPADIRTQADIDRCWEAAENSTGITVEHFDK